MIGNVQDVRVKRSANCGSDHKLVELRLNIFESNFANPKWKGRPPPKKTPSKRDFSGLRSNPELRDAVKAKLAQKLAELRDQRLGLASSSDGALSNTGWEASARAITSVIEECIPLEAMKGPIDWYHTNIEALELLRTAQSNAYKQNLGDPSAAARQKFRDARKNLKQGVHQAKASFVAKRAGLVESAGNSRDSRLLFAETHTLLNGLKVEGLSLIGRPSRPAGQVSPKQFADFYGQLFTKTSEQDSIRDDGTLPPSRPTR
jgi:hypothetical protein